MKGNSTRRTRRFLTESHGGEKENEKEKRKTVQVLLLSVSFLSVSFLRALRDEIRIPVAVWAAVRRVLQPPSPPSPGTDWSFLSRRVSWLRFLSPAPRRPVATS